ncbi:MAG: glucose 1-dehydrogenase [Candidatus Dadabacteria bacterium]|nr:glucose 1-dehydrogenase [Candidatus Dadabacteria bacterium]NIQ15662.1 glucose 1-dehydrogenase [Candidatus Dadabacteria bacterium]
MKLEGKTALITGGSLGLGKATAILFAKEGANVVITGRTEKTLKDTVEEASKQGLTIDHLVSDVSKDEDCKNAVDYTIGKYGQIDILFNNAGVLFTGLTHETDLDMWQKTFDINVKGTFLMSKYTIPHMLERNYGCIVNNSSILGLKAVPGVAAYNSTKGAVTQLTRSMALEYAQQGIRVNAICPGTIVTPMVDGLFDQMPDRSEAEELFKSFHPMGRLGKPDEIANAVLFLCDDNVQFMTGTMLSVDGGWVAK